jgi:hypothetical protein
MKRNGTTTDQAGDGQRDPGDRQQPMRIAVRGRKALDQTAAARLVGRTLFSWLAILAKNVHNFVGPILIVAGDRQRADQVRNGRMRQRLEEAS